MSDYVYIQSEPNLYTVGFYQPDGRWVADSDHRTTDAAAKRVAYLNGGWLQLEERFERRRYALLQAAATIAMQNNLYHSQRSNEPTSLYAIGLDRAVIVASDLLAEIEKREKAEAES